MMQTKKMMILLTITDIFSMTATFSLKMLRERTQSPSYFSTVPLGPYLAKVHLAT